MVLASSLNAGRTKRSIRSRPQQQRFQISRWIPFFPLHYMHNMILHICGIGSCLRTSSGSRRFSYLYLFDRCCEWIVSLVGRQLRLQLTNRLVECVEARPHQCGDLSLTFTPCLDGLITPDEPLQNRGPVCGNRAFNRALPSASTQQFSGILRYG